MYFFQEKALTGISMVEHITYDYIKTDGDFLGF